MFRFVFLIAMLSYGFATAIAAIPEFDKLTRAKHRTETRHTLDSDTTLALTIQVVAEGIRLDWTPSISVSQWAVLTTPTAENAPAETLAVTTNTFWIDSDIPALPLVRFYEVVPLLPGPDPAPQIIEDFESAVTLEGISPEDLEPSSFERTTSNPYGGTRCLRLYGNTWKREAIDPVAVEFSTVWQVAMLLGRRGEIQSFGIADSANYMRYIVWGSDCPQSQVWITGNQGWFDSEEWVPLLLPVGEDWHGRFGYLPRITELQYINDNDNVSPRGEVFFDEIADVTGFLPVPPIADFRWSLQSGSNPDSVTVRFLSLARDADSPELFLRWDFGDGIISALQNPQHPYPAHGLYTVTLTATDSDNNVAWRSYAVADSPVTSQHELRMAFTGDIILARGYENPGGIIPTQGVNAIFTPTLDLIEPLDLASCNLECPLTTATTQHPTKGITFKGNPSNVSGLVFAGFDYATLANNHSMDYMEDGLYETMSVLDSAGIVRGGADANDVLARRTQFLSRNGLSIAMLAFSDRTGSYNNYQPFLDATRSRPGFAMWNRSAIEATVPQADSLADFVVLNVHSGSEYQYQPQLSALLGIPDWDPEIIQFSVVPDTTERKLRHYAIDNGADLVITHHPHIIQGLEVYQGKLIAHSLGNFVFDLDMAETLPSMIVQTHFSSENGIDEAIIHPVYIDHWIPRPAVGGLGQGILDYLSEMSRRLDTWLVRNPGADTARIIWDTTTVSRTGEEWTDTLALTEQEGQWISLPIKMSGDGYPVFAEVIAPATAEIRIGRDLLWFGSMENEGARPWNLNSGDEGYDSTISRDGMRSVRLRRTHDAPDNVVTQLELRKPIVRTFEHSITGWIRTENAVNAAIEMQLWQQRGGGNLISTFTAGSWSGTNDWAQAASDFVIPSTANFCQIRLSLYPPESDTGYAWFDDVSIVQWEAWQPQECDIPFPSDYSFLQVRAASASPAAIVHYRREWIP